MLRNDTAIAEAGFPAKFPAKFIALGPTLSVRSSET